MVGIITREVPTSKHQKENRQLSVKLNSQWSKFTGHIVGVVTQRAQKETRVNNVPFDKTKPHVNFLKPNYFSRAWKAKKKCTDGNCEFENYIALSISNIPQDIIEPSANRKLTKRASEPLQHLSFASYVFTHCLIFFLIFKVHMMRSKMKFVLKW